MSGGALITCMTGRWIILILFTFTIILLYLYSIRLKNTILTGIICIAFLCALSVYITVSIFFGCPLSFRISAHIPSSIYFFCIIIIYFFLFLIHLSTQIS